MVSVTFPSGIILLEEGWRVVTTGRVQIVADGVEVRVEASLSDDSEYIGVELVEASELVCRTYTLCGGTCLLFRQLVEAAGDELPISSLPSDLALELCGLASVDFFRFASLDIAVGLRMVNFVYLTGG